MDLFERNSEFKYQFFSVLVDGASSFPLPLSFWTIQEIKNGLGLKADWKVDSSLLPFYDDWHELIYLDTITGKIVAINDKLF